MALSRIAPVTLVAALGCAPQVVSPPALSNAPPEPAARVESAWSRHAIPAEGITVHATLWDASLVAAASQPDRDTTMREAWARRYVEHTAFTVVIELEDRRPYVDPSPLLAASGWSFGLALNKGDDGRDTDVATPSAVDLLVVDRFPTDAGDHHHRIAMAVFFEGSLYEAAHGSESVALVVKPQVPDPPRGRSTLGTTWAQRGATMRWRLATDGPSRSGPADH